MIVKFRMIVFRPFKGEIILGKITGGTEKGIKSMCNLESLSSLQPYLCDCASTNPFTVSLEFFNDILVPPNLLLDGARLYVMIVSAEIHATHSLGLTFLLLQRLHRPGLGMGQRRRFYILLRYWRNSALPSRGRRMA